MNPQNLLDYHLGQLDPAEAEALDRELAGAEDLQTRSDRLASALELLLDDGPAPEPPAGLADRAIAAAADRRSRPRVLEFSPPRIRFRWGDFAVAAGIFLAGLSTLIPAMVRGRDRMNQAGCMYNLQQVGLGLANYAHNTGSYPQTPVGYPAGYYSVLLARSGGLRDASILTCPCHRPKSPAQLLPDCEEFQSLMASDPTVCQNMMADQYAYNAGSRDLGAGARPVPAHLAQLTPTPLLADVPPHRGGSRVLEGNSPDHGYAGQNVLFSDQSVRFLRTRNLPLDDDIYLNAFRHPALGEHPGDVSLIPAGFPVRTH